MLVLGDEDRRRILYSALLRYGGETQPLRERALQKLVLSALFGTSEAEPLTVGQIQTTISSDGSNAKIRVETIQTILSAVILDMKDV